MAKISKKSFKVMGLIGGLAGGAAGNIVSDFIPGDWGTPAKAGINAVLGAGLAAFVKGDLMQGLGNGLLGAAGYQLAGHFMSDTPAGAGVGTGLPGQNAVGVSNWVSKRVSGSTTPGNPLPSGQQNMM